MDCVEERGGIIFDLVGGIFVRGFGDEVMISGIPKVEAVNGLILRVIR
jgi:hypothetical protein